MIPGSISGALHNKALHHLPTWMYLPDFAPLSSSRGCFCQVDAVNEKLVCNWGGDERAFHGSGAFMFVLVASRLFQTTT